jgi:hypothetical protein
MAPVNSIHLEGVMTKALLPDWFLTVSNSTRLKIGLYRISQMPRNSMDERVRIQF